MLGARVTFICVGVIYALNASGGQTIEKVQTVSAGLNLQALIPKRQIQIAIQLICAEGCLVNLKCHEGAVMTIVPHDQSHLLDVKLVGDDLKGFSIVLDSVWLRSDIFRARSYHRRAYVDL